MHGIQGQVQGIVQNGSMATSKNSSLERTNVQSVCHVESINTLLLASLP